MWNHQEIPPKLPEFLSVPNKVVTGNTSHGNQGSYPHKYSHTFLCLLALWQEQFKMAMWYSQLQVALLYFLEEFFPWKSAPLPQKSLGFQWITGRGKGLNPSTISWFPDPSILAPGDTGPYSAHEFRVLEQGAITLHCITPKLMP